MGHKSHGGCYSNCMTPTQMPENSLVLFLDEETGLGHIRVTDALSDSIPSWVEKVFVREPDDVLVRAHAASSSSFGKWLQEKMQYGIWQYLTTPLLRMLFWFTAARYAQKILQQIEIHSSAEHIFFICTHFAPAHRLSHFLPFWRLRYPKKTFHLIVQVTDDSPQYIWYIPGADLTLVPSAVTKIVLEKYAKHLFMRKHEIAVSPYPVSSFLSLPLSKEECAQRQMQLDPLHPAPMNVCIPISGAVVGTEFFLDFIQKLHARIPKTQFFVVCRETPGAQAFLEALKQFPYVKTYTGFRPAEVVEIYEMLYRTEVIAAEVTKPSEQAFKTMLGPSAKGGVIMLFTEPVGRQEKDNLDYMRREGLLPTPLEQENIREGKGEGSHLWRGYTLLGGVAGAVEFIKALFEGGEFLRNITCLLEKNAQNTPPETSTDQFWQKVASLVPANIRPLNSSS